ncbi:MAG: sn-glycerol-3-phosphate ABC transporter ATP-binding protein UgpC [Elusimicrobia bacterium]|nr:sn-glycerol-3-phosphate ABC transporter ATP-binding protein UgpC [Elusimicrobiota bacterium]
MASVNFKNIVKKYNDNLILDNVNLEIKDHEFVVVVGPSGCGKTTLLRLLAGLEEITSGDIEIDNIKVNDLPPSKREIAMVFQDYALYPHMTVRENMSFALKLKRFPKEEIEKRVKEAATILQLEKLLNRMPRQLSGGQRQRVAIGRAIVRKPKVFLFDEPLSNLDAKLREEMRIEIAKLYQNLNSTIVYVTHDQVEAMTLAGRIVVMNKGIVQQNGTPLDVYRKPQNAFVAGFIGSPTMNFLKGKIKFEGDFFYFENNDAKIFLPMFSFPEAEKYSGKEVILGIRPDDIVLDSAKIDHAHKLSAVVEVIELLGHRENIYLKMGEQRILAVGEAFGDLSPNAKAEFSLNYKNIHIFDAITEKRINP